MKSNFNNIKKKKKELIVLLGLVIVFVLVTILVIIGSAFFIENKKINKSKEELAIIKETWPEYNENRNLQKDDVGFLHKGISYEEIVEKLGEPDRCLGSGVTTCQYIISKNSYISIRLMDYENIQEILYVKNLGDDNNYVDFFEN